MTIAGRAVARGARASDRGRRQARTPDFRALLLDWTGGILPMLATPARLGLGARIGDGRQWTPWIHRDDAMRMILAAIDDPAWRGPVNAVAPDLVTQGEMTRRLAVHIHRPQVLAAPAWLLRLALGEFSDLFLASQRVMPLAALDRGLVFTRPTLERAFAAPAGPLRLIAPPAAAPPVQPARAA